MELPFGCNPGGSLKGRGDMTADQRQLASEIGSTSFLNPKGVALIGASDRSAFSRTAFAASKLIGCDDRLFLVSRSGGEAHGRETVSDIRDLTGKIDTAVFVIPGEAVIDKVAEAAEAGVRRAIVLASGFAELGHEGKVRERALSERMASHGIRMMGPNCLGFINYLDGVAAGTMKSQVPLRVGRLAIVSQSGAIASGMARFAHQQGIGLSHIVATGNESDVDFTMLAHEIVADDRVGAVACFIETVRYPERFLALAELAQARGKALVIIKVGASELSAQVAAAHTGALVGDDRAFDAVCRHYGIIRTHSIEDAVMTAALASHTGRLRKGGLGLLSISGGACEILADAADADQVSLAEFSEETKQRLGEVMPDFCTIANPLDVTGGVVARPQLFEDAVSIVGSDPGVALVGVVQPLPSSEDHRVGANRELLRALGRGLNAIEVPGTLVNQALTPVTAVGDDAIADAELPHVIGGLNSFIAAAGRVMRWSAHLDDLPAPLVVSGAVSEQRPASEVETLRYLSSKGVPTIPFELATNASSAGAAAERFGSRVVVKVASPDIAHKTEAGGVLLNVAEEDVPAAVATVIERGRAFRADARIEGALIAPMRTPALEFVVGIARDPQWGLVLAVGLGGIWVEVMKDVVVSLAGVDAVAIKKALRSLRASKLLDGYRGATPVDLDALSAVIASIAAAAAELGPDLAALEINPLRVDGANIEALDALAIWTHDAGRP